MNVYKRVLVVDDDERVLFVLRSALLGLGSEYEIVTAQSGRDALDEAEAAAFDLLVTDLWMPGIDGVELTEAVKAQSPQTVVIWVTAHGCHTIGAEVERLSVYRCLEKPLKVSEIRRIAREALGATE